MSSLPLLKIGQHVARYPIIQGGMGIRISGANLAAAVANAGGIGIISAVGLGFRSPYFDAEKKKGNLFAANRLALIDELQLARALSPDGVMGINCMMAARDHETLIRTAVEYGANLIIGGAGLPLNLPEYTQSNPNVALVPIVSTVRAARLICRSWQRHYHRLPDAFVVETPNAAGGHLGARSEELGNPALDLARVIPELINYLRDELGAMIPVIAAGGIWDRQDIDQMLALGASGVQMGTRFITTHECDADIRYKKFHLHASPDDVVVLPSPVGLPGRALRNAFAEQVLHQPETLDKRCIANCLRVCRCRDAREEFCILQALDRAASGDVENGLIFAGSHAGRATEIVSVADLMAELVADS
ncbi:MAG: nitronate monooxygenase family protein [Synechococcales bacterium]|nr:nitronate monooxygenase family protein [Synechococcales bacterium]